MPSAPFEPTRAGRRVMTEKLTPDDLRQMSASQMIDLLEERFGARMPSLLQIELSILLGAGEQGVRVVDPGPGGESYIERLDWERLAALLNSGPNSAKTPPLHRPSRQERGEP